MSDSMTIFRQACLVEVNFRIRNQVLVNRLTATSSKITKILWWEMLLNYRWRSCWLSWQISHLTFTCEHVQFEWLRLLHPANEVGIPSKFSSNFRPTSIGRHNSMGHLLLCAIDFKTNHASIHLQWIGISGMSTESRHAISMGPRQPEVPGEAIVCSASWCVNDSTVAKTRATHPCQNLPI